MLGIPPHMISRQSGPMWCLQQEHPGLAAVHNFFRVTPFWGENSAEPPSFKMPFLHTKPIPPQNQPVALFQRASPRGKRMKQAESRGRRDTERKDRHTPLFFPKMEMPSGVWRGHEVTEGHTESIQQPCIISAHLSCHPIY